VERSIRRWIWAGRPEFLASDGAGKIYVNLMDKNEVAVFDGQREVLADLPIGDHVDAVKIDSGQIFASCADGTLAVARETSPGKFEIVQTVKTPPGARTMGADTTTHKLYLPTAESEPGAGGGSKMKPGSFMIVVVSRDAA
jgi:hypothetical protein